MRTPRGAVGLAVVVSVVAVVAVLLGQWSGGRSAIASIASSPAPTGVANALTLPPARSSSPSPGPSRRATPSPSTYVLGFGLTIEGTALDAWGPIRPMPSDNAGVFNSHVFDFVFGDCPDGCGPHLVQVIVGSQADGLIYGWQACPANLGAIQCAIYEAEQQGNPLAIHGETSAELAAAWLALFGGAPSENITSRGVTWTVLGTDSRVVAIAVQGDVAVAVSLTPFAGARPGDLRVRLAQFLAGVQLAHPTPTTAPTLPVTGRLGHLRLELPLGRTIESETASMRVLKRTGGRFNRQLLDGMALD